MDSKHSEHRTDHQRTEYSTPSGIMEIIKKTRPGKRELDIECLEVFCKMDLLNCGLPVLHALPQ
jgi:hypothetical protein